MDPSPVSLDALKWATKSLCNKDDEVRQACEGFFSVDPAAAPP